MPTSPAPRGVRTGSGELTAREAELLTITLEVLRDNGYDRLTLDQVAARAHASKATLYRRWPSKADLVIAAFSHGVRQLAKPPNTGTLRGDLLQLGTLIAGQVNLHGTAIAGVMPEVHRSPRLQQALVHEFLRERRALVHTVLKQAADRGEITADAISEEVWDVLPAYLIFRGIMPGRPPTSQTVQALVDEVLLPSLTRSASAAASPISL